MNVFLLEAQDMLGGRTKPVTIHLDAGKSINYDIGGEYLGKDQNEIIQYVTNVFKTQLEPFLVDTYEISHYINGEFTNSLDKSH